MNCRILFLSFLTYLWLLVTQRQIPKQRKKANGTERHLKNQWSELCLTLLDCVIYYFKFCHFIVVSIVIEKSPGSQIAKSPQRRDPSPFPFLFVENVSALTFGTLRGPATPRPIYNYIKANFSSRITKQSKNLQTRNFQGGSLYAQTSIALLMDIHHQKK